MKVLKCLAIVFLLYNVGAAEIDLSNIAVSRQGDSLFVEITTTNPCLYEHFMIKKAPEKIVVDLKGAINNWPKQKFMSLPFKSIERIRTSQFQAKPEPITRVVLDINRPIGYNIEELPMGLIVKIPVVDDEQTFTPWKAQQALKTVIPEQRGIEKPKTPEKKPKPTIRVESFPRRKVVTYKPGSQRDPFKALVGAGTSLKAGEVPAVENLTLVGVFSDESGDKALFEDSEGNGYILRPSDRVKNGYLVSIQKDKAIFQVTEYGWTRTVALVLEVPELK
jgi:hypothetical protein